MRFFFEPAFHRKSNSSMLEKIREGSQGIIAQVVLGLVILTFAVSGVSSYFTNQADQAVAVVNGEEINRSTFEQSLQLERSRMERQFGEMYAAMAADPAYQQNFRRQVLDRLIDETLLKQQSSEFGIAISDEFLLDAIRQMPEFQVDGVFNNERYLAILRQNNLTANQLRDNLREQYSRSQLVTGVAASEFTLASELKFLMTLQNQTRDIEYATVKAADLAKNVAPKDEELSSWFQQNQSRYVDPEQVSVQYVELTAADLAKNIEVAEADIKAYYDANASRYQGEERRRVSHILLESADENADVKKKAEELLAKIQAGGDFAALAKAESADTVSAENGGDLDFITKGVMEPEFEQAAFALAKVGDVSAVVKTSFGYHIIKLTEIEAAKVKQLDEVKSQIAEAVRKEKASEKFVELQQKLAEVSFEVADNLEESATAIGGKVQSTGLFAKTSIPAALNKGPMADLLFSADFIASDTNSEVIELGPEHVAVVRLVEHKIAKNKTLDEVKTEVANAYVQEQAAQLARQKAEQLLAELTSGKNFNEVVTAAGLTIEKAVATPRFGGSLPAEIRTKAFELAKPGKDKPVTFGFAELPSGDAALIALSKVTEQAVTVEPPQAELDNFAEQIGQSHFNVLLKALREKAEISTNLPVETVEQ
jgi:peptidyl-prolyl cis-trans isomerase D